MSGSPLSLFHWLNEVTRYWFSNSLLITIWVIFLMGYLSVNKDDFIGGSAVASYVVVILGLMMWLMGLASGYAFSIAIGTSLVFTAWLLSDRRGSQ